MLWRHGGVVCDERPGGAAPWDDVVVGLARMAPPDPAQGPRWFPGARLNFAENLLRYSDERPALVSWGEGGRRQTLSYAQLQRQAEPDCDRRARRSVQTARAGRRTRTPVARASGRSWRPPRR